MPTPLGGGLSVVIRCQYRPHHNWMSFASYYSIQKNLPDAEVVLAVGRAEKIDKVVFIWPNRCRVKSVSYRPSEAWEPGQIASFAPPGPTIVVDAGTVAVRELSGAVLKEMEVPGVRGDEICWYFKDVPPETMLKPHEPGRSIPGLVADAKAGELPVFVSYTDGVGNFVAANWIDKSEYPFPMTERFVSTTLTANEAAVLRLWKLTNPVFCTVAKE